MRIIAIVAVAAAGLLVTSLCHAAIYKYTDSQGHIHYTDQPPPSAHAKRVNLPSLGSYSSNSSGNLPPSKNGAQKQGQAQGYYKSVSVATPHSEETIHSAQGIVHVTAKVQPKLDVARGDRMVVYLDGKKVPPGPIPSVSLQLNGVVRGKHTVHVAVVDQKGQVLKSSQKVKFFIHHPGKIAPKTAYPGVRRNTP